MECVGDSLPELTTELVSAYTTQSSEIRLKEDSLQRLDCELVGLRLQLQAVARDVSTTVRTICLREECLAKLGQECESLEGEVCVLVEKKQGLQLELQNVKREKETQDKIQNSYEDKIQHHENKTRELEKLSATQIELQALREKIVTLKAKREMYYSHKETGQVLSGEKQQCLQEELAAVEATRTALQQDNTLLEQKLDKTQEMIKSLKKDMEMGKKRQVAQLKCLQRLLNEAQAERRRWAKKAEGLRANIRQIKQRIEE